MEADFKTVVEIYDRNTDCTKLHEIYFRGRPAEMNIGTEPYKLTVIEIIQSAIIAIKDYLNEYHISCVMGDIFEKCWNVYDKEKLNINVLHVDRANSMYEKNKIVNIDFELDQKYYGFHESFVIVSNSNIKSNKIISTNPNELNVPPKDEVEKAISSFITTKKACTSVTKDENLTNTKELPKKVKTIKKLPKVKPNKRLYQVSLHTREAIEFLTADKWISEGFYFSDTSDEKAKLHAEACLLNNIRSIISKDLTLYDIKIAPSKENVCHIGTIFLVHLDSNDCIDSKYCTWDVDYIGDLSDVENDCGE